MSTTTKERNKDWDHFLNLFLRVKDKETIHMLFSLFMTLNERETMVDRYRLVRTLLEGELTQREIAEQLHLSISKITAGSKAVQILEEKDRQYLLNAMDR